MAQEHESRTNSTVDFFSLPSAARDNIYRRVLIVPHELFLFQESASQRVETFAPDKPVRWPALLFTSRQLHDEARAVLYGLNRFNLVDTTQGGFAVIQSYLARIGSVNAALLSHLSISFPATGNTQGQPGVAMLRGDGLHSVQLLQAKCTNLKTLETYVHSGNSRGLIQASLDDSSSVREWLSQVDAQLKAISSLSKIIVRFYDGRPTPLVMELMHGFGWVILLGDRDDQWVPR